MSQPQCNSRKQKGPRTWLTAFVVRRRPKQLRVGMACFVFRALATATRASKWPAFRTSAGSFLSACMSLYVWSIKTLFMDPGAGHGSIQTRLHVHQPKRHFRCQVNTRLLPRSSQITGPTNDHKIRFVITMHTPSGIHMFVFLYPMLQYSSVADSRAGR